MASMQDRNGKSGGPQFLGPPIRPPGAIPPPARTSPNDPNRRTGAVISPGPQQPPSIAPIKPPQGVPGHFHMMWIEPSLAKDMHQYYGPKGHAIPHYFAPAHAKLTRKQPDELPDQPNGR